jgi:hypothetical protein
MIIAKNKTISAFNRSPRVYSTSEGTLLTVLDNTWFSNIFPIGFGNDLWNAVFSGTWLCCDVDGNAYES